MAEETESGINAIELATELTIAWLGNPNTRMEADAVPAFLKSMHATIGELSNGNAAPGSEATVEYTPAVSPRSSVKQDYIVSLITGQKFKALKRHLTSHGLTPQDYRERYGLKADYPMVAPGYSQSRREIAKKLGLGRKPTEKTRAKAAAAPVPGAPTASPKTAPKRAARPKAAAKPVAKAAPAKRGRPKKSEAPK